MNKDFLGRGGAAMLLVVGLLLAGTCGACWYFKTHQKMGGMAVRLVPGEIYNEKHELVRTNCVELPFTVEGFTSTPLTVSEMELEWLPPDTSYGRRRYVADKGGFFGDISVVVMGNDRTSIHKPQYCLPGGGFDIKSEETIALPIKLANGEDLKAQLIYAWRDIKQENGTIQKVGALFIYYFVAEGQTTPDHLDMLWRMSKGLIVDGITERWGYIAFITWFLPGGEAAALEQSKAFLSKAIPLFQLPVTQ